MHRFPGPVPMLLKVSKATRDRIVCGAWEFDRATGAEIDEDLGWGPGGTGSWNPPRIALNGWRSHPAGLAVPSPERHGGEG